jgi:AcrR family transcriptional regulator
MKKNTADRHLSKTVRNDRTRESFIKAGLYLFGDCGLDGASTRMLAQKAGANISGIVYYFGGKEGLYRAVLEHIVDRFNELTAEARHEAWRRLEEPLDKPGIMTVLKDLLTAVSQAMEGGLKVKNAEKIVLREQTSPSAAFDLLYEGYMKDVLALMTRLVSRYTGQPPDGDETLIQAHTLIGQFISFIATRAALLKNLGVKRLNTEHNELIRRVILGNVVACLKSWAEAAERGAP